MSQAAIILQLSAPVSMLDPTAGFFDAGSFIRLKADFHHNGKDGGLHVGDSGRGARSLEHVERPLRANPTNLSL